MRFFKSNSDRVPARIAALAEKARAGKMDRREFLALASAFGATTAGAYAMAGLAAPKRALAQEPVKGGILRIAMDQGSERPDDRRLVGNRQRDAPDAGAA